MGKYAKVYEHIITRRSDSNVPFYDLCSLLTRLGFERRVLGDHHIFTMEGVEEIINLQPKKGWAKPIRLSRFASYC